MPQPTPEHIRATAESILRAMVDDPRFTIGEDTPLRGEVAGVEFDSLSSVELVVELEDSLRVPLLEHLDFRWRTFGELCTAVQGVCRDCPS